MIKIVLLSVICAYCYIRSIICAVGTISSIIQAELGAATIFFIMFLMFAAPGTVCLLVVRKKLKERKKKNKEIDLECLSTQIETDKK